jgi:hypothetical protein
LIQGPTQPLLASQGVLGRREVGDAARDAPTARARPSPVGALPTLKPLLLAAANDCVNAVASPLSPSSMSYTIPSYPENTLLLIADVMAVTEACENLPVAFRRREKSTWCPGGDS